MNDKQFLTAAICTAVLAIGTPRDACGQTAGENGPAVRLLRSPSAIWRMAPDGKQQQQLDAPGQGRIESLTRHPSDEDRVLLARSGSVWQSADGGASWDGPIFQDDKEQGVVAAFHPAKAERILLATNLRMLISDDAGRTWSPVASALEFKWRPLSILVSAGRPDRVYVATRGHGIFRSDDGGQTWIAKNSGLPKGIGAPPVAPIESAVLDPKDPDVAYAVLEAMGLFKTTNGGLKWRRLENDLPGILPHRSQEWILAIDSDRPRRLLLWANWPVNSERVDSAFFLTTNGGERWQRIDEDRRQAPVSDLGFVQADGVLAAAVDADRITLLSNPDNGRN